MKYFSSFNANLFYIYVSISSPKKQPYRIKGGYICVKLLLSSRDFLLFSCIAADTHGNAALRDRLLYRFCNLAQKHVPIFVSQSIIYSL